jgi:dTDP-4-amino-4,6-dideoxygalactose transaminase
MADAILLSPPHLGEAEFELVREAFMSNWIAPVGPHVDAFEREFCQVVGTPYAAALSSGTSALHLALRIMGIQPDDEVVCSTLTFIASANPILYLGAKPIFIDSDRASWNMDPDLLKSFLDERSRQNRLPKAVILVHLYGQSADIDPILQICRHYHIPLIEDAAEALGASYKGRSPGTVGDLGIYSFNGNKIITTSGGGMLVSRNQAWIEKARFLATQARDPAPHYQHSQMGYNVLAAIGRGQLQVLSDRVAARRRNFEFYEQELAHLHGLSFMPEADFGLSTRWLTCLTIEPVLFGCDRERIRQALAAENIESRPVWKPLHLQPVFSHCEFVGASVSNDLFAKGLCLPSGSAMSTEDLQRVTRIIQRLYAD